MNDVKVKDVITISPDWQDIGSFTPADWDYQAKLKMIIKAHGFEFKVTGITPYSYLCVSLHGDKTEHISIDKDIVSGVKKHKCHCAGGCEEILVSDKKPELIYSPTRREMFAMASMNGILSSGQGSGYLGTAEDSVGFADALIKELDKEKK